MVVIGLHWGAELQQAPNGQQRAPACALTAARGAADARGNQSSTARFTFARQAGPGARWAVRKAESLPQLTDPEGGFRVVDLAIALTREPPTMCTPVTASAASCCPWAADDGLIMTE
ncbi:hypothetical protein AB0I10_02945 [Streptomyces sp. NPDC050636]|uniref:hypothetical protein n=1 Tax=Streptomyces sp. NPDC050636 TaxID=3154510 RepID=UPI00341DBEE0